MPEGVPPVEGNPYRSYQTPGQMDLWGGEDFPADFDPVSEASYRNLSNDDLFGVMENLHRVYPGATGAGYDVAAVLLEPDTHPEVSPEVAAMGQKFMRELVRRAVQMPEWELTKEFLFGEEG